MSVALHLLVIDPQKDFVNPSGSLYVKGAEKDMDRLAVMVHRMKGKLADVHVTLDSHHKNDISHPDWWKDSAGNHPAPFTIITAADVKSGRWTTTRPGSYDRSLAYLEALAATGRYPHVIWPFHCLIGSEGQAVHDDLFNALGEWTSDFAGKGASIDFVTKGSNQWTEHFSAVQAEVPDPSDPSTQINAPLIRTLEQADVILLAGEALSHCVANTVRDIAKNFGDPRYVKKMVLLTDASSPVGDPPGTTMFTDFATDFVRAMKALGRQTATTTDFLAA